MARILAIVAGTKDDAERRLRQAARIKAGESLPSGFKVLASGPASAFRYLPIGLGDGLNPCATTPFDVRSSHVLLAEAPD